MLAETNFKLGKELDKEKVKEGELSLDFEESENFIEQNFSRTEEEIEFV